MSNFSNTLKDVLSRGAKFVGSAASSVAKETKFKASELSELGKRRDLIAELGAKVYELSQNGFVLPEEASALVCQITAIDNNIAALRAEHAAQKAAAAQQRAVEKAARAAEKAAVKTAATVEMENIPEPEMPAAEVSAPEVAPHSPAAPMLNVDDEATAAEKPADEDIPTLRV